MQRVRQRPEFLSFLLGKVRKGSLEEIPGVGINEANVLCKKGDIDILSKGRYDFVTPGKEHFISTGKNLCGRIHLPAGLSFTQRKYFFKNEILFILLRSRKCPYLSQLFRILMVNKRTADAMIGRNGGVLILGGCSLPSELSLS